MAHCPAALLADLAPVLDALRGWEHVRENSPCVFYVKRVPFLHFHVKDDRRWADMRKGKAWGPQVDVPFGAGARERKAFQAKVEEYYAATVAAVVKSRAGR